MPHLKLTKSLSTAFRDEVVSNPAIVALRSEVLEAIESQEDKDRRSRFGTRWTDWDLQRLLEGSYRPHAWLWPVDADMDLRGDVDGTNPIGPMEPLSPLAARVLIHVADVYEAFVAPLRDGRVRATGHLKNGESVQLSPGVWAKNHTFLDWLNCDIGEYMFSDADDPRFQPKWTAVAWDDPATGGTDSSRSHPAIARVDLAAKNLWPSPENLLGLNKKLRDDKINTWLKSQGLHPVSTASIKRYFTPT